MVTKRKKYTLIKCEDGIFGYIHRDVKKEERLALRAVLKEKSVFDITDILCLNVKMLEKRLQFVDNMEVSVSIPFKNFKFNFHDHSKRKEALCYFYFSDTTKFLFHTDIKEDPYLYNFLKKFVDKVNLTNYKMKELK